MKKQDLEIRLLTDCQEHIPVLAKLWYEEISRHSIPDWYTRLGWTHIGDDELFGHRVAVMSIAV